MTRRTLVGAAFGVALIGLGIAAIVFERQDALEGAAVQAPRFEVDPLWPRPLPNHWVIGSAVGVAVDTQDHIWLVHRPDSLDPAEIYASTNPPSATCCAPAPPVLEFDSDGRLLGAWGGPGAGFEWPVSNHGVTVDYKGNVWIGGNGPEDAQVLKFTRAGKFLLQIGRQGQNAGSNDRANLGRPAKVIVDQSANEVYVADGYGNKRVIVFDADTGRYKRHWGAYGSPPDDADLGNYDPEAPPAKQFRNPVHCVEMSRDGLLYVCDRTNDRIQVFKKDGSFVKEGFVARQTLGGGSVWDIAFSRDAAQKFIYLADGSNEKVYVILRETLEVLTSFGDGGRQPGQFYAVHSIATDSKGNVYTAETFEGKRLQKFVYKGLSAVTRQDQGVVWPRR
jgi:DNA-binding beta-propeller fold protein YncE